METTIQKWGNSQAVRLPKAVLELAEVSENDKVQITAKQGQIIIRKANKLKHKTLKERLAGWNGEYKFEEWDTRSPVGEEVL